MKKIMLGLVLTISLMASDIVVDKESGLIWQNNASIVKKDWSAAKEYCEELSLGGYNNWRLPNIEELMSIIDVKKYKPSKKAIFNNVKSDWYWRSRKYKSGYSEAEGIPFYFGNGGYDIKLDDCYVRCVVGDRPL